MKNYVCLLFGLLIMVQDDKFTDGLLYPRESETRDVKSLDGIWNFIKSNDTNPTEGIKNKWYAQDLKKIHPVIPMPVPSSYNDITEDANLRDHVGTVWYDRRFFISNSWANNRIWIRFGSVHYEAIVYINGKEVLKHVIGHLPFEADITDYVELGQENRITVLCDNALDQMTIPQGKVVELDSDSGKAIVQTYTFDFFNYAGIHRSVQLYTTPNTYIKDVYVTTDLIANNTGRVHFNIIYNKTESSAETFLNALVQVKDKDDNIVGTKLIELNQATEFKDYIDIANPQLWWPYLMHSSPAYLYNFEIYLQTVQDEIVDVYRLKIGIRTLAWDNKQFLINGKPIYFRGFGKHEDSDIRGKGLDLALMTKDFNLIKWIGANAYRTSHYPYSEESMEMADEYGIMIIDECPSVDTENFTPALLAAHKSSIEQLIRRDRNHPSVVMWSIANEPRTNTNGADAYFQQVAEFTKKLDPYRPITAAIAVSFQTDKAATYLDVISFNRYNGWYSNAGRLDMITKRVVDEANAWHTKHNKPIIMSEYGADTVEGLHVLPAFVWSEEYQQALLSQHFEAFDKLRESGFFIGEFIWNFADFKTNQGYTRVAGNKKGIFLRTRQPKAAAHHVRKRYFALATRLNESASPCDLNLYLINSHDSNNSSIISSSSSSISNNLLP